MNNMRRLALLALLLAGFAEQAPGQQVGKGTTELGGGVSFASASRYSSTQALTTFALDLDIGQFVADRLEMGFRPQFATVNNGVSTVATLGLYISSSWNFKTAGGVVPYAGLLAGYSAIHRDSGSENGPGGGADGGVKIYIGASSLLLIQLEYLYNKYHGELQDYSTGTLSFGVGFRVVFPPAADKK
jgi:hypothetical protein